MLYLLDGRPAEAVDVLARSEADPIPTALAREHRPLRAQALADSGRLRDLEWDYALSMAATPQASTFAMLTNDLDAGAA